MADLSSLSLTLSHSHAARQLSRRPAGGWLPLVWCMPRKEGGGRGDGAAPSPSPSLSTILRGGRRGGGDPPFPSSLSSNRNPGGGGGALAALLPFAGFLPPSALYRERKRGG